MLLLSTIQIEFDDDVEAQHAEKTARRAALRAGRPDERGQADSSHLSQTTSAKILAMAREQQHEVDMEDGAAGAAAGFAKAGKLASAGHRQRGAGLLGDDSDADSDMGDDMFTDDGVWLVTMS